MDTIILIAIGLGLIAWFVHSRKEDGSIFYRKQDDGSTVYFLDLNYDPGRIEGKRKITFKVEKEMD